MRILALNGSPRQSGTVASLLELVMEPLKAEHDVEKIDVCNLNMKCCTGCMACRDKGTCVLPEDDAHGIGRKIQAANALIVGSPTYWGNMSGPLKLLFDRNVFVFMGESPMGIPVPRQKGKRAVIVTACTTPWPFDVVFSQSRGALRAIREVLHYGGYKVGGSVVKSGSKSNRVISERLKRKARRLGVRLPG